jgi:hypothetical protein
MPLGNDLLSNMRLKKTLRNWKQHPDTRIGVSSGIDTVMQVPAHMPLDHLLPCSKTFIVMTCTYDKYRLIFTCFFTKNKLASEREEKRREQQKNNKRRKETKDKMHKKKQNQCLTQMKSYYKERNYPGVSELEAGIPPIPDPISDS